MHHSAVPITRRGLLAMAGAALATTAVPRAAHAWPGDGGWPMAAPSAGASRWRPRSTTASRWGSSPGRRSLTAACSSPLTASPRWPCGAAGRCGDRAGARGRRLLLGSADRGRPARARRLGLGVRDAALTGAAERVRPAVRPVALEHGDGAGGRHVPGFVFAAPALAGGVFWTATAAGTLHALRAADGASLAQLDLGAPSAGAVSAASGLVFAGTGAAPHLPGDELVCVG